MPRAAVAARRREEQRADALEPQPRHEVLVKRRSRVFQRKTWRSRASMRAIARCCILEQFGVSTIPVKSMLSIPSRYGRYGKVCASSYLYEKARFESHEGYISTKLDTKMVGSFFAPSSLLKLRFAKKFDGPHEDGSRWPRSVVPARLGRGAAPRRHRRGALALLGKSDGPSPTTPAARYRRLTPRREVRTRPVRCCIETAGMTA